MIRVKNTSTYGIIIISFCIFPLIFLIISNILDQNYLLTSLIVLSIYLIAGYFAYLKIIKEENKYVIEASSESITIKKKTFNWKEIANIKTFTQRPIWSGMPRKYIQIDTTSGTSTIVNADWFDIDYKELEQQLWKLKNNCS